MSLDIIIIYLYENKAKTQQNKLTNKKEPNNGLALWNGALVASCKLFHICSISTLILHLKMYIYPKHNQ